MAPSGCGPYEQALAALLVAEGGYVDDPVDRGGPTKYGITLTSWRDYTGRQDATREDVMALSLDDAHAFYREVFWAPLRLDLLSAHRPRAAQAIFDQAVLHGPGRVVRIAQRAVGVPQDGVIGPRTRLAIETTDEREFLVRFGCAMAERVCAIVAADASQVRFLRNWMRRSLAVIPLAWR